MTLKEAMPKEFLGGEYIQERAQKYLNVEVVSTHDGRIDPWPGQHKHVYNWVKLANGYAVGWNENPARGWSFPLVKLKVKP